MGTCRDWHLAQISRKKLEARLRTVNVLIGSGGRRNYLVNWFRNAYQLVGVAGDVCVVDASPYAPALVDASRSKVLPNPDTPQYLAALSGCCQEWDIDLAFTLNDFESEIWAHGLVEPLPVPGMTLLGLPASLQQMASDKATYASLFSLRGIATPPTMIGADIPDAPNHTALDTDQLLVKNRFGSGSAGLERCHRKDLGHVIDGLAPKALDARGRRVDTRRKQLDCIVVQPEISGTEYGLDIVSNFTGDYQGVLARRKLRMRAGETDQAILVDPSPFEGLAKLIAETLKSRGLIDVDIIADTTGKLWLIDVNPRFGGGYPFSHMGGANVPACYLAWQAGIPHDESWLRYTENTVVAKTEDLRVITL
jgi:carbamoyl-phosphate synthase large subunit